MLIGPYQAEKHISDGGVKRIEIHRVRDSKSAELVFSIDELDNKVLSDEIRNQAVLESLEPEI